MQRRSATLEGFKIIFRRPSCAFAEIAWRWSLGFSGAILATFALIEYLNTLPVTADDQLLFRSRQPALIGRALQHILHGSGGRLAEAAFVLAAAYAVAWIFIGSIGRDITLRALLADLRGAASDIGDRTSLRLVSLMGLHATRIATLLSALVAAIAAVTLVSAASSARHPSTLAAVLITVFIVAVPACLLANWVLSLASIFVVSETKSAFGAILAAAVLCRDHFFGILAASFWFGLARLTFFFILVIAVTFALALFAVLPPVLVVLIVFLLALCYFAVADCLYIGRLAAYFSIADGQDIIAAQPSSPEPHVFIPSTPRILEPRGIDPDELILSDLAQT